MKLQSNQKKAIPVLAAMVLPVAGGFDFVFIEYISAYIDSVSLVFLRLALIAILFLIILKIKEKKLPFQKEDIPRFLIGGALGSGLYYVIEAIGITLTGASLSSLLFATVPLFGMIGDAIVYKNKITGIKLIGVLASIAGVAVILMGAEKGDFSGSLLGVILVLIAACFWVAYTIIAKPLNGKYSTLAISAGFFTSGALIDLPIFFLYHPEHVLQLTPKQLLLILAAAVLFIGASQLCYLYGVGKLAVTTTSIMMNLLPFTAVIVTWILFGELLNTLQMLGGIVIIVAITVVALADRPKDNLK